MLDNPPTMAARAVSTVETEEIFSFRGKKYPKTPVFDRF